MSSCYVIGVCGASCSGKTTVCMKIEDKIENTLENKQNIICIISQDSYYKGGNNDTNYDVPNAIDFDLMVKHLEKLVKNETVDIPIYDFPTHSRKNEVKKIGPAKIIIVEGILILTNEKIRNLCDLKVFVEAEDVVCYSRRLQRDVKERGRTFKEVEKRYIEHVVPSFRNYINPCRYYANISLINNSTDGTFVGLGILLDHIEKKIHELDEKHPFVKAALSSDLLRISGSSIKIEKNLLKNR